MKVIAPSFEILNNLDKQSMMVRIEACGRVCYKSEDMITSESAAPFVKKIAKHGHNSVMEMAALTLKVGINDEAIINEFYSVIPKYIIIDRLDEHLLLSGTVRAFRELAQFHGNIKLIQAISSFLLEKHSLLFEDVAPDGGWSSHDSIDIEKISLEDVDKFSPKLLERHRHIAVKFIVNRAVTHEIVRHRPCSFLQESQRYCRYGENKFGSQVTFIKPLFYNEDSEEYCLWEKAMRDTEEIYLKLLETSSPQASRNVLPNSCKTELIVYANLTEWLHIFNLRTSRGADPSMREIMIPLLEQFKLTFPSVFEGVSVVS